MRLWTRRNGPGLDRVEVHILSEDMPCATGQFEYQPIGRRQSPAYTTDLDRHSAGHWVRYADNETRRRSSFQREPSREMSCGRRHTRLAGQVDWLRGTSFHARTSSPCPRRLTIPICLE